MTAPVSMGEVWEAFEKERVNQMTRPVKAAVYIKDGKFRARREDFGGCPINDVSKMARFVMSSMTPWVPKVSAAQWVGLVSRMDENLKAREDAEASLSSSGNASISKWDMAQTEDAEEWYKSICTSEMVRMSALLFLSPEGISVAISKSASKSDIVAALLAEEIPMCPPYVLQALFESMPMVAAEAPLMRSGKGTDAVGHDASLASPQPKRKVARVADVVTPQKLAIKSPQGESEDTESPYTSPMDGESVSWMKALVKVFQEASGTKAGDPTAMGGTKAADTQDRYEMWLKKTHAMIKAFKFVDPSLLSPEHLKLLRGKWHGRMAQQPRVIKFGAEASFSTGVEEEVLVHEGCSLYEFNQGLDAMMLVLLEGENGPALMADRMKWRHAIAEYEGLSPQGKLLYMREFMFKYQGEENSRDWAKKFDVDYKLLMSVSKKEEMDLFYKRMSKVDTRAKVGDEDRAKPKAYRLDYAGYDNKRGEDVRGRADYRRPQRRGKRSLSPRLSPRRDRRRSRSPQRGRAISPKKAVGSVRSSKGPGVCRSRLFSAIVCKFDKCRFSHICPCCKKDHDGAEQGCSAWNAGEAKRVAEEYNLKA